MKWGPALSIVVAAPAGVALVPPTAASAQAEPTGTSAIMSPHTRRHRHDGSRNPGRHHGFSNRDVLPC